MPRNPVVSGAGARRQRDALARPTLGSRAWWAGSVILLVPAVSNGMTAPLNDVALAAFGTAAIFAWSRLHDQPSYRAAITAGLLAGLAAGVKYPALVLCGLLAAAIALRALDRRPSIANVGRPGWPSPRTCLHRDRGCRWLLLVPASVLSYRQSRVSVLPERFRRRGPRRSPRPSQTTAVAEPAEPAFFDRAALDRARSF